MKIDSLRDLCLSFPHTTEHVQWGNHLVFKVAGKIYAIAALDVGPTWLMFKCSPESFAELIERRDIIPAPYLARAKWIALETRDALPPSELADLVRASYDLVVAKLPLRTRQRLAAGRPLRRKTERRSPAQQKGLRKRKKRAPR